MPDQIEQKLDEAEAVAASTSVRLSHTEVFERAKQVLTNRKQPENEDKLSRGAQP